MKTLEVTDEQYAFIQHLREEVAESVVGKYGFVREQDAVQFLIDNFDEDVELETSGEFGSTAADDVAASVGAAIDGEADPSELEEVSYDERAKPDESTPDGSSEVAADDGPAGDLGDGDDGDGSADDDGDGSADDDDMLDEMMSLLETHDDKWSESDSADYRYTVDLPDGSTEQVQTKDDVRALLFKNYR
ncbi:hypothetical protein [Natrinema salsiterrestre]|uniref:Uncharacterized protein n=1 Tax=Natrinema salsiterrestre TaxID=2950540 RepID=A0A9Q4L2V7_9EURY|nr:hypothetical protein [Natrinema salsiterrestre]MDF9746617.1 hypothetical protein [Natrinema salsiterrestre]